MRILISSIALSLAMSGAALALDIRSGLIPWQSGQDGVTVPIVPPVSGPNANVFVQTTNAAGYSTVSDCTYFNVLKVTATDFQVQHKTCKDGTPIKTDSNISMVWFLIQQ